MSPAVKTAIDEPFDVIMGVTNRSFMRRRDIALFINSESSPSGLSITQERIRMKNTKTVVSSAVAGVLSLGLLAGGGSEAQAQPKQMEKCYGIAEAGKNDCQTATSSCAGTSTEDRQADAWIYVPNGTCDKIAGGSLEPKT
jgi:uncharacterized membrane protein